VTQRMHADPFDQTCRLGRRPAGRVEHLDIDRLVTPAGKQPFLRAGQSPVGPQNTQQLR
jgi:hypothetical protein